ncbi:SAM-dependent methyltransferase [Lachnoclostridium sp. An196]|uniref:class I SAM-dependent DNA methyltransferase n=1 Tax=Lachnoclostridium sp. An196 TaxID=1965583 RepID=UPI000B383B4D|nr:class I SAM-dependent methyltransferase [Lachnoclostridium sp. An196]OUP22195.1 SAM-dependent methyltransferase [Lachnoclostridium sp. An196]
MEAYTGFAEVYDLFMDNVPYEQWAEYITGLLREYGVEDGLVLDLGCGTGTMTELLAEAGYDMIGIDQSEEMLEEALEKKEASGHDILYLCQDMREFELYGTVRAIVCVCDSMNYILEEEEILDILSAAAYNYLDYDGLFIFDLNTEYKYREILGEQTIAENREEGSFIWENYYDEAQRINEYQLTLFVKEKEDIYRKFEETHYQRAYSLDTVRNLVERSGLRLLHMYDAFTREPAREDSERIYVICQREKTDKGEQI